jgi:hypothetical protein
MSKLLTITESEKNSILSKYNSSIAERVVETKNVFNLEELFDELISELNFQKEVHLHNLSLIAENCKREYVESYQKSFIYDVFEKNKTIRENYKNKFKIILTESIESLSEQIDSFNNFFVSSLIFDCNLISEQWWNPLDLAKKVYNKVTQAVNYVKQKGIGVVFETLRNALMSGVGTAIQAALSFTGVGAIANEIAWGIMTLYDAYQYFVNGVQGSLSNLNIDLLCLLTAGSLGKVLKGFVGKAYTTSQQFFTGLINSGVGKYININVIKNGITTVSSWLSSAANFMKTKMGIGWASNLVNKVVGFFKGIAEKIGSFVGTTSAKTISRAGVTLNNQFNWKVFNTLAQMSEQDIAKIVGATVTKKQIEAANNYAQAYLKDMPTNKALEEIDKKFGTKMGDAYALYQDASEKYKKLAKIPTKGNKMPRKV